MRIGSVANSAMRKRAAGFSASAGSPTLSAPANFSEIILTEDDELRGVRLRGVKNFADPNFEFDLFIAKHSEQEGESLPLMQKVIQ